VLTEGLRHTKGVGEVPGPRRLARRVRSDDHQRRRTEQDDDRTEHGVGAFVSDEPRGDALVDDIGLLEEQLPRGDGGAHQRDDQQHRRRCGSTLDAGYDEVIHRRAVLRVCEQGQRYQQQAEQDEDEHGAFPAAEAARGRDCHQQDRGDRDRDVPADPEIAQRQRDADELGDDGEEVEQEQVTDAEPAPEPAEAFVDEPSVPYPGDRPEPDDHLLVDDEDGNDQ
jgi:hypothetical protein